LEAYRTIDPYLMAMAAEPRVCTSNLPSVMIPKASRDAKLRGLNQLYYPMIVNARDTHQKEPSAADEISMLRRSMRAKDWLQGVIKREGYVEEMGRIEGEMEKMVKLTEEYVR